MALGFDETQPIITKQQIIAVAFLFALETAMRRSEIIELEWQRIYLKDQYLSLTQTKNGDSREVPLSTRAVSLLRLMQGFAKPFPVDKDVLSTLFRRACLNAKVDDADFHDARATALTKLATKLNVLELARIAGHRNIQSLDVYYREKAKKIAQKLD